MNRLRLLYSVVLKSFVDPLTIALCYCKLIRITPPRGSRRRYQSHLCAPRSWIFLPSYIIDILCIHEVLSVISPLIITGIDSTLTFARVLTVTSAYDHARDT